MPKTLLRIRKGGGLAAMVATATTLWAVREGVRDYEGRASTLLSLNLAHTGRSIFAPSTETNWPEVFGVPLYTSTVGLGFRLPLLTSWTQSPLVFFDWLSPEAIEYALACVTIWLALWSVNRTVISWGGKARLIRVLLLDFSLLGVAGYEMIGKDWITLNLVTHFSLVGIVGVILNKEVVESRSVSSLLASRLSLVVIGVGTLFVLSGHAGNWPMAVVVVGSLVCRVIDFRKLRSGVATLSLQQLIFVGGMIGAIVLNVLVVGFEIRIEQGASSSSSFRSGEGFWMPYSWLGASRGHLSPKAEELLSFLWSTSLSPALHAFTEMWAGPRTTKATYVWGNFFRPDFSGLSLLPVLAVLGWRRRRTASERSLLRIAWQSSVIILFFMLASHLGAVPAGLRPSGVWQIGLLVHPILLTTAIIVIAHGRPSKSITVLTFVMVNVAMSIYQSSYHLSIGTQASGTNNAIISAMTRHGLGRGWTLSNFPDDWPKTLPASDLNSYIRSRRDLGERVLAVTPVPHLKTFEELSYIELASGGVPLVAPFHTKMRADGALVSSPPMNTGYLPLITDFERWGNAYSGQLLDFLGVRRVLTAAEPALITGFLGNQEFVKVKDVEPLKLFKISHHEITLENYRTFYFKESNSRDAFCPLFHGECSVLAAASSGPSQLKPRWKNCVDAKICIGRFHYEVPSDASRILVPLRYDSALRAVIKETGQAVNLERFAGLTSFKPQGIGAAGVIEILLEPDFRMYSRVLLTYINSAMFAVLAVVCIQQRPAKRRVHDRQSDAID